MISLAYSSRLLLAVLGYLALYVLGTNIAWALRAPRAGRPGQVLAFVRRWGSQLLIGEMIRILYYLAGPYLALSWGWASLLDLGLADLDWIRGIGLTAGIGAGALLLLLLIWWQFAQLLRGQSAMQQALWLGQPQGWAFVLREAILLESWWALCRSPMLLVAGPYWGVYLGLLLVTVVAWLNARTRNALAVQGQREGVILTASLAVLSSTLYLFTHNLWLCMALHFVLRWAILTLVHRETTRLLT